MKETVKKILPITLNLFLVLLPLLWVLGVSTKDISRAVLIILAACFLILKAEVFSIPLYDWGLSRRFFFAFPAVFVLLITIYQISKVFLGDHGLDFTVFTQCIWTAGEQGQPITTLVGSGPVNFLTHHFTPILYFLGQWQRIGIPSHLIGILWQGFSLAVGVYALYAFGRRLGFDPFFSSVVCSLLCLHPSFRVGTSWAIHDEVFSVAFVGLAFLCWAQRRYWVSGLMLLLAATCKETLFAFAFIASVFAILNARKEEQAVFRSVLFAYLPIGMLGLIGFVGYFFIRRMFPEQFQVTFDAVGRLSSFSQLASWEMSGAKAYYLLILLAFTLGLPFRARKGFAIFLCAIPFWGASLLSNFPEMYKPVNYYAVLPTYISYFAALVSLRELKWESYRPPVFVLVALIALSLATGFSVRAVPHLKKLAKVEWLMPGSMPGIKSGQRVVASDYDLLYVPNTATPVRAWAAERIETNWDILAIRKPQKEPVSEKLVNESRICNETHQWEIRCRNLVGKGRQNN